MRIAVMSDSHDHLENLRNSLILNPGEIMGKDGDPGFCIVDTETRDIRQIPI